MKTWQVIIFLSQLIPVVVFSCDAAETKPVLRLTVPEDYRPFYYKDEEGNFKGASYEIARTIFEKLGYEIEITQQPSMRIMLAELKSGRQDIAFNLTATGERRAIAFFTHTPHIFESQHLIVRADSPIIFDGDLDKLKNYKFGPIFGWTYGPQFDSATYLQKEYVNQSTQQLTGLLSGRYDIAINNPQYFQAIATSTGISKAFRVLDPAVFTLPVTMAISKHYPNATQLINAIDKELVNFLNTDQYHQIISHYGFEPAQALTEKEP